jgi:hypothetical protein
MVDSVVSILNELVETSKGGEPTRSTAGGPYGNLHRMRRENARYEL